MRLVWTLREPTLITSLRLSLPPLPLRRMQIIRKSSLERMQQQLREKEEVRQRQRERQVLQLQELEEEEEGETEPAEEVKEEKPAKAPEAETGEADTTEDREGRTLTKSISRSVVLACLLPSLWLPLATACVSVSVGVS